jgi:hypothetical protein
VASAGVLDVSPDAILADTAAPTVCITSDLLVIWPEIVTHNFLRIVLQ